MKNFKNPNAKLDLLDDEDDVDHLLKEKNLHYFVGISKEDAKSLIQEHPDIPHFKINNKVYYPKGKLREWLMKLGE